MKIQKSLGINESQFTRLLLRSPHTYKIYTIPKKTGGYRTIAQPAKETKFIQHWLIENVFDKLPIHDCATAYKTGASIKKNAIMHQENKYIAKFDFKDFFSSINESNLIAHFEKHIRDILNDSIKDAARISCIKYENKNNLCLSVGAPSSPILSNTIMYDFDQKIFNWCFENDIVYTRYADDLTFSTNKKFISSKIESTIVSILNEIEYPKIRLNNKKTIFLSKKNQRRITGIIINNDNKISLGRDKKRLISALIHKFTLNLLSEDEKKNLQGLLSFAKDIEPEFISRMVGKYTHSVIESILIVIKPKN